MPCVSWHAARPTLQIEVTPLSHHSYFGWMYAPGGIVAWCYGNGRFRRHRHNEYAHHPVQRCVGSFVLLQKMHQSLHTRPDQSVASSAVKDLERVTHLGKTCLLASVLN